MRNAKLAGTTKCLDINAAAMSVLDTIRLSVNPGATPTPLTIGASAPTGFASGLTNDQGGDIASSLFPAGWNYFPKFNSEPAQVASRTLRAGVGLAAGQASYYESGGGRYRAGYDGTNTVLTTAGGEREIQLIAGAAAVKALRATAAGIGFNPTRHRSTTGLVAGSLSGGMRDKTVPVPAAPQQRNGPHFGPFTHAQRPAVVVSELIPTR